jgi:hypothetical protein
MSAVVIGVFEYEETHGKSEEPLGCQTEADFMVRARLPGAMRTSADSVQAPDVVEHHLFLDLLRDSLEVPRNHLV